MICGGKKESLLLMAKGWVYRRNMREKEKGIFSDERDTCEWERDENILFLHVFFLICDFFFEFQYILSNQLQMCQVASYIKSLSLFN